MAELGLCTSVRASVLEKQMASASPGPALYGAEESIGRQASSTKSNAASFSFGSAKRDATFVAKDTPGPAQYDAAKSSFGPQTHSSTQKYSGTIKFTTAERNAMKGSDAPGPNAYSTPSTFDRSKAGRPMSADSRVRNQPAFSFGTAGGAGAGALATKPGPGPGSYATEGGIGKQTMSTRPTSARMKFSTAPRYKDPPAGHAAPGPQYEVGTSMGKQPLSRSRSAASFSFGKGKLGGPKAGTPSPAPGSYGAPAGLARGKDPISTRRNPPGFKMGAAKRRPASSNGVPGPGAYGSADLRKSRVPSFSFGASSRDSTFRPSTTPGPGAYRTHTMMGAQPISTRPSSANMKFTVAKRDGLYVNSAGPGPGRYSMDGGLGRQRVSSRRSQPSFSFGHSKPAGLLQAKDTPGPNAYDVVPMTGKVPIARKPSTPGFKFTTAADRAKKSGNDVPGPQYDVPASMGKQPISTRRSHGAPKFGTGKRFDTASGRPTPAPGSYSSSSGFGAQKVSTLRSAPGFTMGAR